MSSAVSQYADTVSEVEDTPKTASAIEGYAFSTRTLNLLRHRPKRPIRSQSAILAAILESCRTPSVQHWIMVKARLGYDTFWLHMNTLLSQGMLDTMYEGSKTLYRINAKGLDLLRDLTLV